jgi:hypothetical protein
VQQERHRQLLVGAASALLQQPALCRLLQQQHLHQHDEQCHAPAVAAAAAPCCCQHPRLGHRRHHMLLLLLLLLVMPLATCLPGHATCSCSVAAQAGWLPLSALPPLQHPAGAAAAAVGARRPWLDLASALVLPATRCAALLLPLPLLLVIVGAVVLLILPALVPLPEPIDQQPVVLLLHGLASLQVLVVLELLLLLLLGLLPAPDSDEAVMLLLVRPGSVRLPDAQAVTQCAARIG